MTFPAEVCTAYFDASISVNHSPSLGKRLHSETSSGPCAGNAGRWRLLWQVHGRRSRSASDPGHNVRIAARAASRGRQRDHRALVHLNADAPTREISVQSIPLLRGPYRIFQGQMLSRKSRSDLTADIRVSIEPESPNLILTLSGESDSQAKYSGVASRQALLPDAHPHASTLETSPAYLTSIVCHPRLLQACRPILDHAV
jgi:hypothetical protein